MKFLASDLTVREQSWRRGRSLYECWVRLGRRWWRTCWGLARMFLNRVSSASSASCDTVGSVSWYRLSRTARPTCASIRPLFDLYLCRHYYGDTWHARTMARQKSQTLPRRPALKTAITLCVLESGDYVIVVAKKRGPAGVWSGNVSWPQCE